MSSHQPQGPYGPLYNPHLPAAPSPAVNYGMQRYPNQPPAYNGYWQGQISSNGMPFSPNTNGYAHNINAQSSVPPAFSARVVPTAYGGYPGMPQYSAAPAQIFSAPPSSAYAVAPHVPQPQVIANNTSHETLANHPPNHQTFSEIPSVDMEAPEAAKEPNADLEDGELSNGDQGKSSGDSYEKSRTLHEQSPSKTPHIRNNVFQDVTNRDTIDLSSDAVNKTSRPQSPSAGTQNSLQYHSKVVRSNREQALNILRELHSFNIGFQDIAREGFDVDLLRELFTELGLPAPGFEQIKQQLNNKEVEKQILSSQTVHNEKSEDPSDKVQTDANMERTALNANNVPHISSAPNPDEGHIATSTSTTPVADARLPGVSKGVTKAPATKPIDRKEYIARLRAAKIGKPYHSSEAGSETPQASAETKATAPTAENPPTDNAEIGSAASNAVNHTDPPKESNETQNDVSDFETKRKAQTELALQKMEALRAQKKLQERVQSAISKDKDPPTVPSSVEISNSAPSLVTRNPQPAEETTPSEGRQASYFSPVSLKPAFSIPGLFTGAQEVGTFSQTKPLQPANSSASMWAAEGDSTDTGVGPRKRLKAADFMEPTPGTLQKSLSNGNDTSVVIDISDDEIENPDDYLGPQSVSKIPPSSASAGPKRENQESLLVSPPESNTPSKFQEPQELRIKESEIESMNRKILELEQRIKAKQAASRVQSPRPPMGSSSNNAVVPEPQKPSILASQHTETATEEQLLREKEKQEDKLATAEAEQMQDANNEGQLSEKARLNSQEAHEGTFLQRPPPNSEPKKDVHGGDLSDTLSNIDQQRVKLQNELSMLNADIAKSEEEIRATHLDIERLSEKIDVAKLDVKHCQSELQKKSERRQLLQQQLTDLPRQDSIAQASQQMLEEENRVDTQREDGENSSFGPSGSRDIPPQSATIDGDNILPNQSLTIESHMDDVEPVNAVRTIVTESAMETEDTTASHVEPSDLFGSVDHSSDGELEEDIMDISGSDVDEGEVLEARQDSVSKREDDMDTSDDEDFYEPPSHVGSMQQPATSMVEDQRQVFDPEPEPSSYHDSPAFADGQVEESNVDEIIAAKIQQEDGVKKAPDHGFMHEDGKDDDDYEPPEPEISAMENQAQAAHSTPQHEASHDEPAENVAEGEKPSRKTAPDGDHFIPYESPLKQFASYRLHPEFKNEIPGGYRSLTYSNNIQPEIEICQYELDGGVCNDKACTSQHFEKMVLPDHIILSAMGKGEGTTPEEKDEYIKGLRSLIMDLRERKIKDLNAIAGAIALYRLRFLNDSSMILPL